MSWPKKMTQITDLPLPVLEAIFSLLPDRSQKSITLTTRAWSHVYKKSCCRDLLVDLSSDTTLFASQLKHPELAPSQASTSPEQWPVDTSTIAKSCPNLLSLTLSLTSQQYKTSIAYFCWLDACIETVVRDLSCLHTLRINLPRVICSGSISIPPETIVLADAAKLWSQFAARGKRMREIRFTASLAGEQAESERETAVLQFLSSGGEGELPKLTFTALRPAVEEERARDENGAETGGAEACQTSCPELEQASSLLRHGLLARLSEAGRYSLARRTVDDVSAFVHAGAIAPPKKARPMPVWLTVEEEQDRREGPPSQSRRAKRALVKAVSEFVGVWRPPMTETAPRTAGERARSRETGFGGRAGWSKSSLAMRVFYRR